MGITKTELAEAISTAIRKEFGGVSRDFKAPFSGPASTTGFLQGRGKKYAEMFPGETSGDQGFNSFDEFLQAAYEGRDSRLKTLSEGTDSAGGFSVPTEYAAMMLDVSLESELIRPRCQVWPMSSNTRKVPGLDIGSHESHLYGGVVGGWIAEGGTMTAGEPKFRQIQLTTKKLYTYAVSTTEIFDDGAKFEETLGKSLTLGLGWYLDDAAINGTGAGQCIGILNCPSTIEIDKETGQPADSIQIENCNKMLSRLHAPCWKNAIWLAHPTTYPELAQLSLAVGTGGSAIPALKKSGEKFTLMDIPLYLTEKVAVLGDKADLMLIDPTQYAMGIRKGLRLEKSIHQNFSSDKIDMRCILRVDGQGTWNEALTLKDGSTTVSCFVVLGERA